MDGQTYAGVINLTPDEDLPDSFQLKISVNKIGDREGDWHFHMPVSKLQELVKSFISMASIQVRPRDGNYGKKGLPIMLWHSSYFAGCRNYLHLCLILINVV